MFIFVSYKKITYFSSKQDMNDWFEQANEWYQSKQKGSVSFTLLNETEEDEYSVVCKIYADDKDVLIEVVKELFDLETDQIEKFIIQDSPTTASSETRPLDQTILYHKPILSDETPQRDESILSDQAPQANEPLSRNSQSLIRRSTKNESLFAYLTDKGVLMFLWLVGIITCILAILILIFSTYASLIPLDAALSVYAAVMIGAAALVVGSVCYNTCQYFKHKRR